MGRKGFTNEEKLEAIELHIHDGMGYWMISERYGVSTSTVRLWIRNYRIFGVEGLIHRKSKQSDSSELKRCAVEEYLSGKSSQADICKKYKIFSRTQLRNRIKMYNSHRELRPGNGRGSDIHMTKGRNTTYEERVEIVSCCIEQGNDYAAAIERYGVSYRQIYSWVRKYNEKGAEGPVDKRGKRKPESEMTEPEKLQAENRLLEAGNKRLELECAVLKKLEEIERRWR